jgi:hypothetical protein
MCATDNTCLYQRRTIIIWVIILIKKCRAGSHKDYRTSQMLQRFGKESVEACYWLCLNKLKIPEPPRRQDGAARG